VALTFAGEDREQAEQLARELIRRDVRVFYDKFETARLLGEDLRRRYRRESRLASC
jgi:hypothetical protein